MTYITPLIKPINPNTTIDIGIAKRPKFASDLILDASILAESFLNKSKNPFKRVDDVMSSYS